MDNTKERFKPTQAIEAWLARLDLDHFTASIREESFEERSDVKEEKQKPLATPTQSQGRKLRIHGDPNDNNVEGKWKKAPTTPIHYREASHNFDEISPTNTNFSYDSVFDVPEFGVTVRRNRTNDGSVTSVANSDRDWDIADKEEELEDDNIVTLGSSLDAHSESLNSYAQPLVSELELESTVSTYSDDDLPPLDPTQPRFVWITSCLQCTYAGLPCSRTPPHCLRCKRSGNGDLCLLQRRKVSEERIRGGGVVNGTPVLLRLQGEDEKTWERKAELGIEASTCIYFYGDFPY
ncbi:hypothetical protein K504DRAFT_15172 [Pleomassaria siparia CBS 279.74]|uniref:Uncharacterized protein n=1 Tax=Pleomassaria siparia CBS 279.74 TaxID=1314801 RepID=A0A6G1KQT2_9PLEO|nr:hypothetical protein K504DRAFT_15172 [Pleomassaria siparia CBS 279.74]